MEYNGNQQDLVRMLDEVITECNGTRKNNKTHCKLTISSNAN